ncbi:MAG TPA: gluconate 2-dehydrogenase subunit 3 family protein [Bryobacteraceae bacterium]|nr:gluconate 2-dehydrogenase subunit 3 family protein [Bryobacteraceae bacterium]
MAGQNFERREVLRALAMGAAASGFPGFELWAFGCPREHAGGTPQKAAGGPYQPRFFTPDEYALIERVTELIIPSDGTPGAREAGVAEFVDFMVSSDAAIQYPFRYGAGWLDAHALQLEGRRFVELSGEQQTAMLEHLAHKERYREGEEDGRKFFELIREYTVMGYYTSRVGLKEIGDPGLNMVHDQMPGCPDPDAGDHRNHRYG